MSSQSCRSAEFNPKIYLKERKEKLAAASNDCSSRCSGSHSFCCPVECQLPATFFSLFILRLTVGGLVLS